MQNPTHVAEHRSKYLIKFTGLAVGDYEFDFELGNSFFEKKEDLGVGNVEISSRVVLHKHTTMQLDLFLKGKVELTCVRCLETFYLPIEVEKTLLVRAVDHPKSEDDDDDTLSISVNDHEIDLQHHLYDFLVLQIPFHPTHPDDDHGKPTCNPEVIKLLEKQGLITKEDPKDPRWDALKNIKLN